MTGTVVAWNPLTLGGMKEELLLDTGPADRRHADMLPRHRRRHANSCSHAERGGRWRAGKAWQHVLFSTGFLFAPRGAASWGTAMAGRARLRPSGCLQGEAARRDSIERPKGSTRSFLASSASMSSAHHGSCFAGARVQQHRSVRRCDCPAWFSLDCFKQRLCRKRVKSLCDAEILPVCSVARAPTASRPRCGWRIRATVGEPSLALCARLLNRLAALRCLATAAAQASGRLRYARAAVGLAQHGAARLFCDAVCIIVCRTTTSSAGSGRSSKPCAQY